MPGETTTLEATAATAVTAVSPASFPDLSAAAPVAALEAALAAASMAAPSGASMTLRAVGTPATEPLPRYHPSDASDFFCFFI